MALDQETKSAIEGALNAFNELKNTIDPLKTDVQTLRIKTDAFDQAKLDKLAKDINDGIELSQKAQAKQQALEENNKAMEIELSALKTAFNRAPNGSDSSEGSEKKLRKKMNSAFNAFARVNTGSRQMYFDEYLKEHCAEDQEIKSMLVGNDPNGGFLVLPEFGGIIKTQIFESSPIRQLADVITIGSDMYDVLTDSDQAAAGWTGESTPRTNSGTPVVGKIQIPAHEMYAYPKATQKLLDDAMIDIEAWLAGKVADIFGRTEATTFVTGNGVAKPFGFMSYAAGTDITQQQVEQVNTGDAANFTYNGLVGVQNALKEPYQRNATWLYRRASNLNIMEIKDGQGRPIFNMTYDKNAGLEPSLLGAPVRFAADVAAMAANALVAAYGDFKQAYQIVDRMGTRVLRDPYTDKPNVGFYTTRRVGGGLTNFEALKIQKMA
ncbi:phage major capsid protein [Zavarzinella formosa]|uniref:phage major capsid protein n=1 Tax=Zavarzinella formosa TaxID=360055 RepID=UPI0002D897AF|nr:phage major capsid protein [Zavarzinella formosa]